MVDGKRTLLRPEDRDIILQAIAVDCPAEITERSLILLYLNEGLKCEQIGRTLNVASDKISYWRKRYLDHGLAALNITGERKRNRGTTSANVIRTILEKTERELPEKGRRWTTRSMAQAVGVSDSTIRRVWRSYGIAPHLTTGPTSQSRILEARRGVRQRSTACGSPSR